MRAHLAWIRVTTAVAIAVGAGGQFAAAQYAPYRPMPAQAATPVQPTAAQPVQPTAQTPYVAYWQQAPQQAAPVQPVTAQPYPQTSAPYVPTTTAAPAAPAYPQVAQYPSYPSYPYVAYQSNQPAPAAPVEDQLPPPSSSAMPANGAPMNGADIQPTPANGYNAYPSQGCNCANGYPSGYPSTGCNGNSCDTGDSWGISRYFDNPCYDSQWFGGIYYLYMERDRPSTEKLTVSTADAATYPYFPAGNTTVLVSPDHDFRSGVEVRLGSTFTISACDSCDSGCYGGCNGCNSCCPATVYAWEVAWWGLDDDVNDVTYFPQPGYGIYGMRNFAGLLYDRDGDGVGFTGQPVNGYYGYALPIPAPSDEILAQRVRTNFKAQNVELNIIRFPVCDMGCGGCNSGCNNYAMGCNSGCNTGACGCEEACCSSAFSMFGSCGVRYFRTDDDFMYATEFIGGGAQTAYDGWSYNVDNELYYDVQVENNLIGPQVGWSMNYCYGCKWNFFLNSNFGVFNNHIEHYQRMWSGGGGRVYFQQSGEDFVINSDKDDISFLGELRLGGSYDFTCHWRGVLAYRAVAVTGIATSTDQIPSDFSNPDWIAIVDSDSSLVVHGVQVGAECRY